ncbi:HlyD family efflux transporter periplasmic adaptor subunit [Alienimonas californiensis]|uniref:HlyD family secretion protein n=1 Tax=Alienimonas californiensis TaxID=2527989 RepID=A0A517P5R2_9PLAN|nr:HlyD family efflux transporter periplasmic adaptor subunit [Alienimonas californiensis]QDT14713.1 hypothetical protein CA12_07910 [Alienimonas californiensis]
MQAAAATGEVCAVGGLGQDGVGRLRARSFAPAAFLPRVAALSVAPSAAGSSPRRGSAEGASVAVAPPPGGWADVERMLDEAAALVRADLPAAAVEAAFLNRLCRGSRAAGAAIWDVTGDAREGRTARRSAVSGALADAPERAGLIAAASGRPPALVPPLAPGAGNEDADADDPGDGNPTRFALALCPIAAGGGGAGGTAGAVLEAAFDPAEVGGGEALALEAVRAFAEIWEEARTRREVARLREELARQRAAAAFAARLHAAGDLAATERLLADGGRAATGADRLAVAAPASGWLGGGAFGGGNVRVRAISDAAVLDRRAGGVRSLEQLAVAALRGARAAGRDRFSSGEELPPAGGTRRARRAALKVAGAFADHLSESGAARTEIVVLRDPGHDPETHGAPVGVLIADLFPQSKEPAADRPAEAVAALEALAPHAAAALARARSARRGPLGRTVRWLTAPLRRTRLPWTVPLALAVAGLAAALVWVQAPFDVTARGRLVPVVSRDVFAPRDGIVRDLKVQHDSPVQAGDVLAVLADPTLELRAEELAGEADTAVQRLAAVRAERAAGAAARVPGTGGGEGAGRLAAEERELVERLAHLAVQAELLEAQQQELTVTSPIAGRVLTWGLTERLPGRPVPRGARLMTVADTAGPWRLELFVPDRHAGPLLDAAAEQREANGGNEPLALPVTYLLAADPGPTYTTTASRLDPTVEPHAAGPAGAGAGGVEPSVRVFAPIGVRIEGPAAFDVRTRPGATVVARIRCGERALGYVWLHDLIDAARTRLWW